MKRILAVFAVGAIFLLVNATLNQAGAQSNPVTITVPVTTVRAPEGSLTTLATVNISAELVGTTCEVRTEATNNSSVHPGNDVIIESDGSSVVLFDVEGFGGKTTQASGVLVLGSTATVTLRMGPDEVFSAGLFVFECSGSPATTTTTTTTTATTTTTVSPTTTTVPVTTSSNPPLIEIPQSPAPIPTDFEPNFTG